MNNIDLVYLDGKFLPAKDAKISAFDRGFIFGDGIYEVIPVFGGHAFRLAEHLQRLTNNLAAISITNPNTQDQWAGIINKLIDNVVSNFPDILDQMVYIQITRGVAPRDHAFPGNIPPTVFAYADTAPVTKPEYTEHGVSAITCPDNRWQRCEIKATSLLANVLLRQEAAEKNVTEAILIRDNFLTEGAASNIFIVKNKLTRTPPRSEQILPGITRDLLIELIGKNGLPGEETMITEQDLLDADEIWMTSSVKEILPVTLLNGNKVGDGRAGPVYKNMLDIYRAYKQSVRDGSAT